jgi:hypothetical protein
MGNRLVGLELRDMVSSSDIWLLIGVTRQWSVSCPKRFLGVKCTTYENASSVIQPLVHIQARCGTCVVVFPVCSLNKRHILLHAKTALIYGFSAGWMEGSEGR